MAEISTMNSEIEHLLKNEAKIYNRGNIGVSKKKLPTPILTNLQIVNGKSSMSYNMFRGLLVKNKI